METIVKKKNSTYADAELCVLTCILYNPKLISEMIIDESNFKHYGYVLNFFKKVYEKYGNLDPNIMFSVTSGTSLVNLMDVVDTLTDVFVIESHFKSYQKRVLEEYCEIEAKKDIRRSLIKTINSFIVGEKSIEDLFEDVDIAKEYYKNRIKNKLDDFEVFASEVKENGKETV